MSKCNKCGESCLVKISKDISDKYGLVNQIVLGGFYSTYLQDCTKYRFSICEKCLKELFETFKIPVETQDYSLSDFDENWR